MQKIIKAVDRKLIKNELTKDKFVRNTNFGFNQIYIFTAKDSPNTMLEVGRLREISFRDAGGGTGKAYDIDDFDTMDVPYKQLIVWNPKDEEIIGGYRFIKISDIRLDCFGKYPLATANMFNFSEVFVSKYLQKTIELGRSFVQPKYQPAIDNRKGIFSLDNLWDGLGFLLIDNPEIQYFFGKVTLYLSYNQEVRDAILFFMHKFFPDNDNLVVPFNPKGYTTDISVYENLFNDEHYESNYKKLLHFVRARNKNIPPLINAYMGLSPSMKTFGSSLNPSFGEVEEVAILIDTKDIYNEKKERHINTYCKT